jgi:transcriptional regulator with XRE-family HTH domain
MPRVPKQELPQLSPQNETIGDRIAKYRKLRGMTQQELAEAIGIERILVSDYERGRIRLYDEMLGRFALALKVTADTLLGIENEAAQVPNISLRFLKRLTVIETFPEAKKKHILRNLDDSIKANTPENED